MCDHYKSILLTFPGNHTACNQIFQNTCETRIVEIDASSILLNKFSTFSQYKLFVEICFCICMYILHSLITLLRTPIHLLIHAIFPSDNHADQELLVFMPHVRQRKQALNRFHSFSICMKIIYYNIIGQFCFVTFAYQLEKQFALASKVLLLEAKQVLESFVHQLSTWKLPSKILFGGNKRSVSLVYALYFDSAYDRENA